MDARIVIGDAKDAGAFNFLLQVRFNYLRIQLVGGRK